MPFDPAGIFSLIPSYKAEPGKTIRTEQHNPPLEDIASGLSSVVLRDGRAGMVGPLPMGGFPIQNMADGINSADAATKGQLDAISDALGNASGLDVGTTAGTVAAGDDPRFDPWAMQPIGVPIPMLGNLVGVVAPPKDKAYRYVLLTAGETGSGAYNEGILTGESVSGSAPLVVATAVISLAGSPINGRTINLINTERRFLRAGSAGSVQNDAMQRITGAFETRSLETGSQIFYDQGGGALGVADAVTTGPSVAGSSNTRTRQRTTFDSANSPDARTDTETRPKNIGVTYYLRIK